MTIKDAKFTNMKINQRYMIILYSKDVIKKELKH